jgi:parvulin-like peptidyl-prolyl isomerase
MALPWQRRDIPEQRNPNRRRRSRRNRGNEAEEGRRQTVRRNEERRRQYLAITIGAMLILAIFAIVLIGYYREFYEPPRVTAGEIRGVEFSMGDLVERIRVLQGLNRYQGGRVDLSTVPFEYLQGLLNAEILRQAAPGLGITVTEEDIDGEIRRRFYPASPEGETTDPGQLDREFRNNYQNVLTQVRLSEDEYRVLVEEGLHQLQLTFYLGAGIPDSPEQVEVEWIRLDFETQVDAQEVRQRLDEEDFAAVASEVGDPVGYADQTGMVGWVPQGAFPDLDDVLFGNAEEDEEPLAVDAISDAIFIQDGIFIIHKLSGPEEHQLAALMRFKLNQELVKKWQNEQLGRGSDEGWLKINFDSYRYAWVADQVRLTAPRIPQQPGQPNQGQQFPGSG